MKTNEVSTEFIRGLRKLIREAIATQEILEDELKEPVEKKKSKKNTRKE